MSKSPISLSVASDNIPSDCNRWWACAGLPELHIWDRSLGSIGQKYSNVIAGDYNQDGTIDLASVGYIMTGEAFSILTNNGDGTFVSGKDYAAGIYPQAVVSGDFNGDGRLDLAITTTNQNVPSIGLYGGTGNGAFTAPKFYPVGSSNSNPMAMVTGDFNHDGRLDLAVADSNDNAVSILLGAGNGTFTQTTYPPD